MNALESAREEINRIDAEMAALFEARMKAVAGVAAYKKENGLPIRDPAREEALIARCRGRIADPAVEAQYVPFLRSVIDVSCAYQDSLNQGRKVAFSGVEGAYAHIAARKLFPEARFQGYASFEQEDGVTLVNLPSLACGNHHGDDRSMGIGVLIEVYADRVAIRPRNFARRTMNRSVTIKDGKPYWEQRL